MKQNLPLLAAFILLLTIGLTAENAVAQTPPDHVVTINTAYMLPADSIGRAELRSLLKEYFEKVTAKNEFVLHESTMVHYYSDDSRELITINEFASWGDVDKANDRSGELEKLAWPDPNAMKERGKKMQKYISYHKDGIYHMLPGMSK